MDEPWKHFPKWNKQDTEDKYIMIPLAWGIWYEQIHKYRELIRGGGIGNAELCLMITKILFGVMTKKTVVMVV